MKANYGVSFVNITSDAYYASVIVVPYAKSCYVGPRDNSTRLSHLIAITRDISLPFYDHIIDHINPNSGNVKLCDWCLFDVELRVFARCGMLNLNILRSEQNGWHFVVTFSKAFSWKCAILGHELGPSGVSPNQRSLWKLAFSTLKHV